MDITEDGNDYYIGGRIVIEKTIKSNKELSITREHSFGGRIKIN